MECICLIVIGERLNLINRSVKESNLYSLSVVRSRV
jgi:hypothetical protein